MKIYQLKCIDTNDNEHTVTKWVKPFESLEAAQLYAEEDCCKKITWSSGGINVWVSHYINSFIYEIQETELIAINDVKLSKPKLIRDSDLDLTKLKYILIQYMEYLSSDNYHEDNDYVQYIFETTLETFYGKDIFDSYINKIK
jgi:hypothetical protein